MTVLGPDRQGLVQSLSAVVADHGGNWLESRMARLAGQFAGILRVECPEAEAEGLAAALKTLEKDGLSIQFAREQASDAPVLKIVSLDVVGNDRPGIVRQLAAAISGAGGNVEELVTGLESAAMSGHPIFRASGTVALPEGAAVEAIVTAIEKLGPDLSVEVK
ncbi:MAG: ACT domain-containing protein [Luteolibacter sp.]